MVITDEVNCYTTEMENEASISICLYLNITLSRCVSTLFNSFHYFKKLDCCSFPMKRTLPPSLRNPYYPDFSVTLSSHTSFLAKSFLRHQLLDAVAFDDLTTNHFFITVYLPDYPHDTVLLLVLMHISNCAYTGCFYILSPLMLSIPLSPPSLIFIPLFSLCAGEWGGRRRWEINREDVYAGNLQFLIYIGMEKVDNYCSPLSIYREFIYSRNYHIHINGIFPQFTFSL